MREREKQKETGGIERDDSKCIYHYYSPNLMFTLLWWSLEERVELQDEETYVVETKEVAKERVRKCKKTVFHRI